MFFLCNKHKIVVEPTMHQTLAVSKSFLGKFSDSSWIIIIKKKGIVYSLSVLMTMFLRKTSLWFFDSKSKVTWSEGYSQEKATLNKSPALTKCTNIDLWVAGKSNQLFIGGL